MTRTLANARANGGSGKRNLTVAFLLVATVFVLADVIGFGECRLFSEDRQQQLRRDSRQVDEFDTEDYISDGAATAGDDDEDSDGEAGGGESAPASILTSPMTVEAAEGTTVNLQCKVSEGSLDDVALIWINGTKSIMTDAFPSSTDPRVKPGPSSAPSSGPTDHTLIIEQVTRWDTGPYTCKITSSPPVEITHTLRVTHPARILSIQSGGASGLTNIVTKKLVVKQGDPVQLICNAVGYPNPTVLWTRKPKHHPHAATTPAGQDQNPVPPPTAIAVSNTNEVRIESVSAHQHAGFYECVAHNSDIESASRLGIDLEIEYQPEVNVPRTVVNTGETYPAQVSCSVHAHPKPKVTWEKEQIPAGGGPPSWQPIAVDNNPNGRYETPKTSAGAGNRSSVFALRIKQVQGPQDFGNYRCRAENKLGITYSKPVKVSGAPAQPRTTYVQMKPSAAAAETKMPESGWAVDSWSPLMEYQLQYKKQQDTDWTDVRPQPAVTESAPNNAGDERKYTMSYVFGVDGQQAVSDAVPFSLEQGVTYVAHLRARNVHGWSDWSSDVVLTGGVDDGQGTNEINHQRDDNIVMKGAVGGTSGASGPGAVAATVVLTAVLAVARAVC